MRISILIEGNEGVTWREWEALATACEESGVEGLFRSDHYQSVLGEPERECLDAWGTLAGLAARTSRIRLGTLVSPVTFRHPVVLAKIVTTVDHISNGRAELGLGAGWYEPEHRSFGFPYPPVRTRLEMLENQLEFLTEAWTQQAPFSSPGGYASENSVFLPAPVQQPYPPLIVGGRGLPRSIATAVRYASEYNAYEAGAADCRARRSALDQACEAIGRDPTSLSLSLAIPAVVGASRSEVRQRLDSALARIPVTADPSGTSLRDTSQWIVGKPGEVSEQLRAFRDAGVDRAFLRHWDHTDIEMISLIGAEVVPAMRA